ncbi:MAG: RsmE family RNA methyltransferase [Acidimicrobiales bacterium]
MIVADISDPVLDAPDAHHLETVLRLRPGEPVGVTDGRGGYARCVYAGRGAVRVDGPVSRQKERRPRLTVGFAPVKGDRPEWAVQKLTELGVDRIVAFDSARCVVRWDDTRADRHLERLRRVARSALMQSRQCWLPDIEIAPAWRTLLAGSGPCEVALAQPGAPGMSSKVCTVLVGPEGGWSDDELCDAPTTVGLGAAVLRTETAAVAAGVLLAALRAGLVAPAAGG